MRKVIFAIVLFVVNCILGICKFTEWLLANRVVVETKIGSDEDKEKHN